ncbi:hypothetical protein OG806_39970 [Streptomyces sp. NBC_00882]|uniref:hypothetical protein n=1 Tax=Streptomyces sp. NBC_00882 TaxID=2975856 RepID=UPI00386FDFFD|nr:hypothetical protein OG806_39970 [Streptomyces sp. NBC_00882]
MGVILWYQLAFPTLGLTVSSDVSSGTILSNAKITVSYALGQLGTFTVDLTALPTPAHRQLAGALSGKRGNPAGALPVVITLGYLESPGSRKAVLRGRVDGLAVPRDLPPPGVRLTGYEEAAFQLLSTKDVGGGSSASGLAHFAGQGISPAEAVQAIVEKAGATLVKGATPDSARQNINLDGPNAFELLRLLAERHGAELLVQDGTVQFGTVVTHPPTGPLQAPPNPAAILALLTGEDTLFVQAGGTSARLAAFKPIQATTAGQYRVIDDLPESTSVAAFDFTVLGLPELRAGQLVAASVDGYQSPLQGYRIIHLTHAFSPRDGYVCSGRAAVLSKDGNNRKNTETAREGSPTAIADAIAGRIGDARTASPSVDVGQVTAAKPDRRVADLRYGQGAAPKAVGPSVDLPVDDGGPVLPDKPLAAPFAWHGVGLSVPLYPGMRALLNDVRGAREDSVVNGFLWTNDPAMDRPKAKEGDWWLCLPTDLTPGPDPRPQGKCANDLTAKDGRRVVEAVGLKLAVGTSTCTDVGARPAEGQAEEFQLTHSSGTQVRIDAGGNVTVRAGTGATVTVSAGKATVTLADNEVAVSVGPKASVTVADGKVAVSAGGASLTVQEGKVAIT